MQLTMEGATAATSTSTLHVPCLNVLSSLADSEAHAPEAVATDTRRRRRSKWRSKRRGSYERQTRHTRACAPSFTWLVTSRGIGSRLRRADTLRVAPKWLSDYMYMVGKGCHGKPLRDSRLNERHTVLRGRCTVAQSPARLAKKA